MAKRLRDSHPHMQRFNEACEAFAAFNIRIDFMGHRTLVTIDGVEYDVEDVESQDENLSEMPPVTEVVLVLGR